MGLEQGWAIKNFIGHTKAAVAFFSNQKLTTLWWCLHHPRCHHRHSGCCHHCSTATPVASTTVLVATATSPGAEQIGGNGRWRRAKTRQCSLWWQLWQWRSRGLWYGSSRHWSNDVVSSECERWHHQMCTMSQPFRWRHRPCRQRWMHHLWEWLWCIGGREPRKRWMHLHWSKVAHCTLLWRCWFFALSLCNACARDPIQEGRASRGRTLVSTHASSVACLRLGNTFHYWAILRRSARPEGLRCIAACPSASHS
jgi:hypothetical protein